ncbi:MAG: DUF1244 domain-containing protein [Pseudomonadota bacterium]
MAEIDPDTETALEAAVFRRLRDHLRNRTDVQNIDLMTLSGFCRNCLSRWYQEAAHEAGVSLDKAEAREIVYGMPYDTWRNLHQTEVSPEQQAAFAATKPEH